ncbi:MAG: dihydropteroate synthase [Ilumatobacteraceae bacterium]
MGIVNVTPDSFSDGGLHAEAAAAIEHGRRLVTEGAVIVDVGGESTRPGAVGVTEGDELDRVLPVVEALARDGSALVSIDTRKPAVARAAVLAGAHLVNDVSGLRDPAMVEVCATLGVPAVVVHMRGDPVDMQLDPRYDDVVVEVVDWLHERADHALAAGVPSVMIDPGIGFGKTIEHNLALLRALPLSQRFPVLVGASRKGSIRHLAGVDDPGASDIASVAAHLFAAQRGAAVVRVHDVAAHRQAFAIDQALRIGARVPAPDG